MGTRGLNGWVQKGKYYGQYNQFDTYPSGLGNDMVKLAKKITKEDGWEKFKENALKMKRITKDTLDSKKDADIIARYIKFFDEQVSTGKVTEPYALFRHLQGMGLMEHLYLGNIEHYRDQMDFINDSLFCEYAWFFNLDTMMFEGWKGFQHEADPSNPFGTTCDNGYYPCKRVVNVPLTKIPRNWAKPFERED